MAGIPDEENPLLNQYVEFYSGDPMKLMSIYMQLQKVGNICQMKAEIYYGMSDIDNFEKWAKVIHI